MTTWQKAPKPRAPSGVVLVPVSVWADGWEKPASEVAIGLRLLSNDDLRTARAEAAREAVGFYADRDGGTTDVDSQQDAYNDALMRWAIARGTCDPNDVSKYYFPAGEDAVRFAFTPEGLRFIWEALERHHIEAAVGDPACTDEDLEKLAGILHRGIALSRIHEGKRVGIRKLLSYVLAELEALDDGPSEDEGDEDDVPVYTATAAPQ